MPQSFIADRLILKFYLSINESLVFDPYTIDDKNKMNTYNSTNHVNVANICLQKFTNNKLIKFSYWILTLSLMFSILPAQAFDRNRSINNLDRPFSFNAVHGERTLPDPLANYSNGNRVFRYDGKKFYENVVTDYTVGSRIGYRYDEYYATNDEGTNVVVTGNSLNVTTNGNFNNVIIYSQQVNTGNQTANVTNDGTEIEIR